MEDYTTLLEEIREKRSAGREEKLTRTEIKEYRKYTGKISWLVEGTRPDLSHIALQLGKQNNIAMIFILTHKDLKRASPIMWNEVETNSVIH